MKTKRQKALLFNQLAKTCIETIMPTDVAEHVPLYFAVPKTLEVPLLSHIEVKCFWKVWEIRKKCSAASRLANRKRKTDN